MYFWYNCTRTEIRHRNNYRLTFRYEIEEITYVYTVFYEVFERSNKNPSSWRFSTGGVGDRSQALQKYWNSNGFSRLAFFPPLHTRKNVSWSPTEVQKGTKGERNMSWGVCLITSPPWVRILSSHSVVSRRDRPRKLPAKMKPFTNSTHRKLASYGGSSARRFLPFLSFLVL